jgi:hypothetical protein
MTEVQLVLLNGFVLVMQILGHVDQLADEQNNLTRQVEERVPSIIDWVFLR